MNQKRYKEFRDYIRKLKKELTSAEFFKVMDTKILDYAFKNPGISTEELQSYVRLIFTPSFGGYVRSIEDKYMGLIATVNDLYSDIGTDVSRDYAKVRAIEQVNSTYLGEFSKKEIKLIAKRTREGLNEGLSRQELKVKISEVSDAVSSYADTISHTQIAGYGRVLKYQKAQLGEVFYYRYADLTLRENSHELCKVQVPDAAAGISKHINVINKMNNGEGQPKPVMVYCGGWHCYHDWEPDPFYEG